MILGKDFCKFKKCINIKISILMQMTDDYQQSVIDDKMFILICFQKCYITDDVPTKVPRIHVFKIKWKGNSYVSVKENIDISFIEATVLILCFLL